MTGFVRTVQRDQIFEIKLNRPDKRNALNWPMMEQIDRALDDAERAYNAGQARVLFFSGEGSVFCAGIDLYSFIGDQNPFGEGWRDNLFPTTYKMQHVLTKIEESSLPAFCLIHGHCLGLGMELALACDFRIVEEGARIGLPETRLGMIPDVGGTTRLTRLVGPARAKEIIMTGTPIDLEKAERWGVVNYVVPPGALHERAEAMAHEIGRSAPLAVSYAKRVINDIVDHSGDLRKEAMAQAQLIRTRDFETGVQAMLAKEPPQWQGK